jgi:glycosyltransferase involved in cell wall biosynthesis
MRVTFVLPGASPLPSGGPRMVFRYANALAERGWAVTIVMPSSLRAAGWWGRLARRGRYLLWSVTQGWSPARWIRLDARVNLSWVPDLSVSRAPVADAVVATAVQTAEVVAAWPERAGRKFYFVQGYETWDFPADRVRASWRLPFRKIAVSQWLCGLIAAAGEAAVYLPNALDHEAFGLDRPPEARDGVAIVWPHQANPLKGADDVRAALSSVVAQMPAARLRAFGTIRPPSRWPFPVEYHRNPSPAALRRLYNDSAIAVMPSHSEGWGLTACEALQCGCALAASDIGGHREFLRHESNALLHVPGDPAALRANLLRLLADAALRARLARQGMSDLSRLRIEPAVERLERMLRGEVDG